MWQEKDGSWRTRVNSKKVRVHRQALEDQLGRILDDHEVVVHKDGNKLHNAPENLEIVPLGVPCAKKNREARGTGWATVTCAKCGKETEVRKYYFDRVKRKEFCCPACKPAYYNKKDWR